MPGAFFAVVDCTVVAVEGSFTGSSCGVVAVEGCEVVTLGLRALG